MWRFIRDLLKLKPMQRMRDKVSEARVLKLHESIRAEVLEGIIEAEKQLPEGDAIRITQGLRTWAEQAALYAKGRTAPGAIVTRAKPGSSFHNYGLAIDVAIVHKDGSITWEPPAHLVAWFKSRGWTWGGDFKSIKDKPHLEKSFGKKVDHYRLLYEQGKWVI